MLLRWLCSFLSSLDLLLISILGFRVQHFGRGLHFLSVAIAEPGLSFVPGIEHFGTRSHFLSVVDAATDFPFESCSEHFGTGSHFRSNVDAATGFSILGSRIQHFGRGFHFALVIDAEPGLSFWPFTTHFGGTSHFFSVGFSILGS